MVEDFLTALALVFIIEGMLPFISPGGMRRTWAMISQMDDKTLRIAGLASMLLGVILLYLFR
jgi:hypothetical protein